MSDTINDLAKALCKMQGEINNVQKDTTVKSGSFSYKYAELADCIDVIKKPLKENGLALSQIIEKIENTLYLSSILMHTSGQWIKSSFPLEFSWITSPNKMQGLGSVISYARRYSLLAIIGLAQDDDDANSLGNKGKETSSKNSVKDESLSQVQKLKILCNTHQVSVADFGKTLNISSADTHQMQDIIDNFENYYGQYVSIKNHK